MSDLMKRIDEILDVMNEKNRGIERLEAQMMHYAIDVLPCKDAEIETLRARIEELDFKNHTLIKVLRYVQFCLTGTNATKADLCDDVQMAVDANTTRIEELEAAQAWHPASEPPTEEETVIIYNERVDGWCIGNYWTCYQGYVNGSEFCQVEATHWRELPPVPNRKGNA